MFPGYELIFLVLVPASLFDLWRYQVPNVLHGSALIISLIRHLDTQGIAGLFPWFLGIILPFILCYFFYRCRMLGAADSKLFSVVGSFVGSRAVIQVMIVSLLAGAVMAVAKILLCKNGVSRFRHFYQYVSRSVHNRRLEPYYNKEKDGEEGIIPFSIAISVAVLWCVY